MDQTTGCIYGWTKEVCAQDCGCTARMQEPIPIEKVSTYDRTVPGRIVIPVVKGSVTQHSQIEALRNRCWRYIKSTKGRKVASWFGETADVVLLDQEATYETKRQHLQFLLNLFLRDFTEEIVEIVKGCS